MRKAENVPLVSIIMPAYNHEKYVAYSIHSILEQNYPNLELIIVDDGSTDNTLEKIKELEEECKKRFVRFILKTQTNQGTCTSLNRLIHLANGEYIALIASDDLYKQHAISTMIHFLRKNEDYVLAVGDNEFIDSTGKRFSYKYDENNQKAFISGMKEWLIFTDNEVFSDKKFGKYETFLVINHIPNGYLIRASALKTVKFTPEAPLEDWYMHLQLSKLGKYKYIDEILFSYRKHDNSISSNHKHMLEITNKTLIYERLQTLKRKDAFSEMVRIHHTQQKALQNKYKENE